MDSTPSNRLRSIVSSMSTIGQEFHTEVTVSFKSTDLNKFEKRLNALLNRYKTGLVSLTPAMKEVRKYIIEEVIPLRFEEGNAGDWPPLAMSTLRERVRLGFPEEPMLVRTGGLYRQVTTQKNWKIDSNKSSGTYIGKLSLLVSRLKNSAGGGDTVAGGQFLTQQYGSLDGFIPARQHVPNNTSDLYPHEIAKIKQIFLKYFNMAPKVKA